jgi:hypothetical protein
MDATAIVFRLLERQVLALEKQLKQIALQPEEGRVLSAMYLRNTCFDFIDEYGKTSEELRTTFLREQDERYQEALQLVREDRQEGRGWPYGVRTAKEKRHDAQSLVRLVQSLAQQGADYEARLAGEEAVINQHLTIIFSVLQNTYKVSLKRLKR